MQCSFSFTLLAGLLVRLLVKLQETWHALWKGRGSIRNKSGTKSAAAVDGTKTYRPSRLNVTLFKSLKINAPLITQISAVEFKSCQKWHPLQPFSTHFSPSEPRWTCQMSGVRTHSTLALFPDFILWVTEAFLKLNLTLAAVFLSYSIIDSVYTFLSQTPIPSNSDCLRDVTE